MRIHLLLLFFTSVALWRCDSASPEPAPTPAPLTEIRHRVLTEGMSHPWEVLWGADNFIWTTERGGQVSRINPANGERTIIYTVPDAESRGEGGLLGMVLHPQFATNPFVYLSYNYNGPNGYKEKVVRFRYNGTTLTTPLILVDNIEAAGIHNGSRLLIHENKLFITTGDAAMQSLAQNTTSLNGKVLRINLDGSIPADNPIPNNRMWTWGHRNAQGLVLVGSQLFSSEHGPDSDDEINILEKGRNYGWPEVKGFCDGNGEQSYCNNHNVNEPIRTWTPTAALCGMDYYNADLIPKWKNSLLVVALKNSRLYVLKLNREQTGIAETAEFFQDVYGRLRDLCIAPNGKVYISTSNGGNDKIIEVSPK